MLLKSVLEAVVRQSGCEQEVAKCLYLLNIWEIYSHVFSIYEKKWYFSTETAKKYIHLNYCVSEKACNNSLHMSTKYGASRTSTFALSLFYFLFYISIIN